MSWSASFPNGVRASALADDLAPENATASPPLDAMADEVMEQFNAARSCAWDLIEKGTVGDSGKVFNVSLAGHANPGHLPAAGWAYDTVSISVSQRP